MDQPTKTAGERLKDILWEHGLLIGFENSTDEFFLLDSDDKSYASGKTFEELVESFDSHGYE